MTASFSSEAPAAGRIESIEAPVSPDRPAGFVSRDSDGTAHLDLMVENVHCANCIRKLEEGLRARHDLVTVRLNFSTRRLHVAWNPGEVRDDAMIERITESLEALGFPARPVDQARAVDDAEQNRLLRCLAVAGFASANIMLLSVSVWSGAEMGPATRDFMHWISGLIAIPAVAYSGRPFFESAVTALKARRLNMDVPISLAVILAVVLSVVKTANSGTHAYFDASVMLLFFLLIGRFLDRRMRARARSAAQDLLALQTGSARRIGAGGTVAAVPVSAIAPGDRLLVAQGDRVPVDARLVEGRADLDVSLLTGESRPQGVGVGEAVLAGSVNLSHAVTIEAEKTADDSVVAEIVRLMETAEQGRARYVRLADRAASVYAPTVHILSFATFIGWWIVGGSWAHAAEIAIAVLIITCPCALGLAVPVVQVVASGSLFRRGILVKSADGLERLAEVDHVVFDKTGTLTDGHLVLLNGDHLSSDDIALAAQLARASRHPLSKALAEFAGPGPVAEDVQEHPGLGLRADLPGGEVRLGSAVWCGLEPALAAHDGPGLWLRKPDGTTVHFAFADQVRADAGETITALKRRHLPVELLSGDVPRVAHSVGSGIGIDQVAGGLLPADKVDRLNALQNDGRKVLMVGDGLNDAPSLSTAHASISPSSAAEIAQTAADIVFQGDRLRSVLVAWATARTTRHLILVNFALALIYNMIAVPLAVFGFVTPIVAAIAMSASSVVVIVNALRLPWLVDRAVGPEERP